MTKETMEKEKIWHSVHYTAGVADLQIKREGDKWTLVLADDHCTLNQDITELFSSELSLQREEMKEKVEKLNIRNNKKPYNGNDLNSACQYYRIAASDWAEIVRYENGHDDALTAALDIINEKE